MRWSRVRLLWLSHKCLSSLGNTMRVSRNIALLLLLPAWLNCPTCDDGGNGTIMWYKSGLHTVGRVQGYSHPAMPLLCSCVAVGKGVGASRGGSIAWFTTALHPHVVERLVVLALPHPIATSDNFGWKQFLRHGPGIL